jgi:hypothetical protein
MCSSTSGKYLQADEGKVPFTGSLSKEQRSNFLTKVFRFVGE